jgi:hypothetical protein
MMNRFTFLKNQLDKLQPKIKQITGRGFNFKFGLQKGKEITYKVDPTALVNMYMTQSNYYNREHSETVSLVVQLSTSLIGASNDLKHILDNYLFVSPHTETRCISDCLAIMDFVRNDRHALNIFSWVKT